jgi:hypothetical protein
VGFRALDLSGSEYGPMVGLLANGIGVLGFIERSENLGKLSSVPVVILERISVS